MKQLPRFADSYPKEQYVQLRHEGEGSVSDAFDWVFTSVHDHLEALRAAGRLGCCKFAKRRGNEDALFWNDYVDRCINPSEIKSVMTEVILATISDGGIDDKGQSDDEAYRALCDLFDAGNFDVSYFEPSTCHMTGTEICFALQNWTGLLYGVLRQRSDPSKVHSYYLLTSEAPREQAFETWQLDD